MEEYLDKTDDDQLYEVEAIIDERRRGKAREFRVKWKVRLPTAHLAVISSSTSSCLSFVYFFCRRVKMHQCPLDPCSSDAVCVVDLGWGN